MAIARIDSAAVAAGTVEALGLDPAALDLFSPAALAASLRRAASVLCPATPGALVSAVLEVLADLPGFSVDTRTDLEDLLDELVAYGDLLELPLDGAGTARRHLFLGPPAFVRRSTGCIVVGIRPDGAPLLGDELDEQVEYNRHLRLIPADPSENLADTLLDEGLMELVADQWLRAPREAQAGEMVETYATRLAARPTTGHIEEARILDSYRDVTYYRGRWRTPRRDDNGHFVARRPQAYGAELWSFVSVEDGAVNRVLDLPVSDPLAPAADEAWRLQAAIDAVAGHPQTVRIRSGARPELTTVDLFGPLPSWAQRRFDAVGIPVLRSPGALFSYHVPHADLADELASLNALLWMESKDERGN